MLTKSQCVRANAEASPLCVEQCRGCSFMQGTLEMLPLPTEADQRKTYPGLWDDAKLGQECEGLIALKTHFTGEPPYVGNEGVLLALREALDELNELKCRNTRHSEGKS